MAGTRRLLSTTSLAGTFLSSLSPHAPPLRERPWPAPSRLPVTSRRHLFPSMFQAQMAFTRRVIFLTLLYHTSATSSHLERLDAAKAVFFFFFFKKKKKVEGKVESSFFILYTQAFCERPANLPKGGGPLRAPSPRPRPLTAPPPASRGAPPLPGQLRCRPAATRRSPPAQGLKTRPGLRPQTPPSRALELLTASAAFERPPFRSPGHTRTIQRRSVLGASHRLRGVEPGAPAAGGVRGADSGRRPPP